jgi:flagellar motor protein MotB
MDKLMNILPDNHISNETLWIYKDNIEIFNKYNQQIIHTIKKEELKQELKQEPKQEPKPETKQEPKPETKQEPKQEPKPETKLELKPELKQEPKPETKQEPKPETKQEPKPTKQKNESPVDLILRLTLVNKIMKPDIKDKLIEFISLPEFSKVFGMKKTSEIMTAISKESWNQSISLFISFLLNKNIIYKDKSYIYNKEKVISQQTIIIS